jgi:hypothetical protein
VRRLLVPFLALLAVAAFFAEYLPPHPRLHIFSDLEIYHYPLQRYAFDSLKAGRIPQWDPSMYCGISYAGNPQAALFYPPMWLLYALPSLSFKALEIFAIAHVWLAFVLCWIWLRNRRLDPVACAFGAGAFAFGGYLMWQIVHLGVLMAVPWMPLAFLGMDQFAERRDWRVLWKTALASALWFLAGYPPSWVAFCVTLVIYALAGPSRRRAVIGAAAAIAASMLLAMVQILPALEASRGIFEQARYTSTLGSTIVSFFVANWVNANQNAPHNYLECLYVYWGLPAIFAVLYALGRRDWRPYGQAAITLAACLFLVLDPGHVVYYTIVHVPLLERTMQSYNFYEGAAAMAALITALGFNAFLKSGRAAQRWVTPGAVTILVAWTVRQFVRGGAFPSGWTAAAETAIALVLFALAASTRRRGAIIALLLFAFADYKVYGTNRLFNTRPGDVDEMYPPHAIRGISEEAYRAMMANRQYRVTSDGSPSSMEFRMYGLSSPQGLDPLLSARYRGLMEQWGATFETTRVFRMNYGNRDMLETLGVRYAISYAGGPSEAFLAGSPDFRRVGPDSFYHVYEYVHAQPAYRWEGEARPTGWLPERRAFTVRSAAGGRFVLAEQQFPGWRATVDGRAVPIELWRGAFQAVDVPAGEHSVVFEYRSRWLPLGAGISAVALLALLAAIRWPSSRTSSSRLPAGSR